MVAGLTLVLLAVLALALIFDYVNGFHDTANAIATSVSTRALKPQYAIALSAAANFIGALAGTEVAKTVGSGLISHQAESQTVVAAALVGGISWNLITWRFGIPSSSSHALIGGLLGGAVAAAGVGSWNLGGIVGKVLIPLVTSPVAGFAFSLLLMVVIFNLFRWAHPRVMNDTFRRLQVLSAGFMAFSHGSNDAQKTMGVMTLALVAAGVIPEFRVPLPVILAAATAMSLGTAAGGWRIIRTMGSRVVKLDPVHGFAAETTAASVLLATAHFGMPVSTTHVISGAIMGAGSSDRFNAVRWVVARNIGIAWVLTNPASGAVAAAAYLVLHTFLT
jgi:PiT family inorganic phosphate transporter